MVLFAMLPVIPPGVNRFWSNALGLDDPIPTFWLYLTLWSMAAAILAQENIKKVELLEYPELGMEAVWKIDVEDFPAFILVDDKGNDFFANGCGACLPK